MKNIAAFSADCRDCGAEFAVPLLSDFQCYGEFVAKGTLGRSFAYLNAFEEPAWDEIERICEDLLRLRDAAPGSKVLAIFHDVVGACGDEIEGESWRITKYTCPRCHSNAVRYGDAYKVGYVDVPTMTFERFMKRPPQERYEFIRDSIQRFERSTDPPSRATSPRVS